MTAYRIFKLRPDDHIAGAPTIIDCPDDDAAIEEARQQLNGHILEVWRLDRRVVRIEPQNSLRDA
jgi:hypothetical protein